MNFFDNYRRGDNDHAGHRPSKSKPPRQISSVYEDLFDQLIQGHSLTVPRAHVSISSLKTQWVRWRQKLSPSLGFDSKVLETEDLPDGEYGEDGLTVYVRVFLRAKKVPPSIPYSLHPKQESYPDGTQEDPAASHVPKVLGSDEE